MGKKSRAKRGGTKKASKPVVQQSTPKAVKEVVPASLSGQPQSKQSGAATPRATTQTVDSWTEHVRTDVIRILLLLVVIAFLIGILAVVNHKTTYLKTAGQNLGSALQLQ